jgi:hypothetical protein
MSPAEQRATGKARPGGLRRLWRAVRSVVLFVAGLWATLAIYYSNLPWPTARLVLAIAFAAFSVWALWLTRRPRMGLVFAALFLAVFVWERSIPPSNDRQWRPEVAVTARAAIDGDRVRLTGVRDFTYRSADDFTPKYVQREVYLSHLTSVDLFISYWTPEWGPVAHTFVSFNFDNDAPVCISIEARPEIGEGFDPIASIFKQFELIYVVGEERDIVGVRTTYRDESVFRYPIQGSVAGAQQLFLVYLRRINELADRAEWYSLFKSNCTLNIIRYARAAGWTAGFDPRIYLNGWVDRFLYQEGLLDRTLPFKELRERGRIHATIRPGESAADFSRRIR